MSRPSLEEFAEAWSAAQKDDGSTRYGYRDELAETYGVSPVTIDYWVRRARDRGLLPEANRMTASEAIDWQSAKHRLNRALQEHQEKYGQGETQ